jgi:hypothetical protein
MQQHQQRDQLLLELMRLALHGAYLLTDAPRRQQLQGVVDGLRQLDEAGVDWEAPLSGATAAHAEIPSSGASVLLAACSSLRNASIEHATLSKLSDVKLHGSSAAPAAAAAPDPQAESMAALRHVTW